MLASPPLALSARALLVTAVLGAVHLSPATAQTVGGTSDVPVATGARTDTPPVIDGRLDDNVWAAAPTISGFLQHEPFEGRQPTERTEIHVLYDETAIYIGAAMFDRQPTGILTGENRRDANIREADAILIVLDTFFDRQNAYVFGTTPAGIEYDGQITKDGEGGISTSVRAQRGPGAGGGFNLNWDGSWDVATTIDEAGWYAEFRIPFATIRYGSGGPQQWGLNIARTLRRTNEEMFWAPIPRQYTLHRVSQAGTLDGIEAPARRTMRVTPYALSSAQRDYVGDTTAWSAEFGGDVKIGLTPGLGLDLTYNTDFAQVEADEQQINLTRFSLFLPEKRPFFLENAGTFSVGTPRSGSDLGLDLFYSRRIGIGGAGEPVPIIGGGRLTGRAAGLTLGLLDIQTERISLAGIPANNYAVGRFVRELPNRSQLGAIVLSRLNTDSTADYNLTYALDGRWGIGPNINLDFYAARTETPALTGREHGLGFTGAYRSRTWEFALQYRDIGEDFNPEVGFLPRADYRGFVARIQRNTRVRSLGWLRELRPHIQMRGFWGFDGFHQTGYLHIDNAMTFSNGAALSTAVNFRTEGLQTPFAVSDTVTLPPGTYDFVETLWRFNTNESAAWSFRGVVTLGGFFSGHRKSLEGTITNRIGTTWVGELGLNYDDVDLAEGSFENTLARFRLAYSFTPRIFLQGLIQYTNETDNFSGNVRFGWLNTAGTGLYVVFNELRRTVDPTGPINRTVVVKFTRQFGVLH